MPGGTIALDVSATPVKIDGDTLTVQGTSTAGWPIQGLGQATLTLSSVTLTVTTADATTATVAATLPITQTVKPAVSVTPTPGQAGAWSVALTGPTNGISPTELLALGLGSGPLPFDVPQKLDVFGEIATVDPSAFAIRFAPNDADSSAYFAFGVSVATGSWHLIPDVVDFTGLDVLAVITTGSWSVTVIGHLSVGGVAMTLGIGVGTSPVWTASLLPDGTKTFPGIVELADWFSSGGTLGPQTQTGFTDLKLDPATFDFALAGVQLSFDTEAAKVVALEIDSVLTVIGLQLDLVLTLPAIVLAGSLARPGTKVVDMLAQCDLDASVVPAGLAIETASFSADAPNSSYTASVVIDGIWPSGPLQLNELGMTVGYAAGSWNGVFDAQLGIAGVVLDLSATYDAGWVFLGRTPPGSTASIGALIADLGTEFGIETVPTALKSLTLVELSVGYTTTSGAFAFSCTSTLDVNGEKVTLIATIDVTTTTPKDAADPATTVGKKGYSARFGGTVLFDGLEFDLVFDLTDDADIFVADYLGPNTSTELKALVAALSSTLAGGVPDGIEIDLTEVKFCFYKSSDTLWAFGLRLGTTIDLSQLPVVGSKLPPDLTLGLDNLQALYASTAFTDDQLKQVNAVLPAKVSKLPDTLAAGIALQGTLTLGGATMEIGTGVTQAKAPAPADVLAESPGTELVLRAAASPPATSTDPIHWIDVNKQFGVFDFRRVGIGYADNKLLFSLDAAVAVGPLAFSMTGLTVGSPLDRFAPAFSLDGLALSFDRPPILLGGAFLRVSQQGKDGKPYDAYYGQVMVQLPQFSLTAVGGWAPDADPAMFFIYLAVDAPIGGPPFLQITGLSGGFGINSRLVLPEIDKVGSYALLPGPKAPAQPSDPAKVISDVLPVLQSTFQVQAGQYWVAAGIAASSFEMITVQAVVSVGFGVDVQIGVVGTGSITLPSGEPEPVAYIELDVVASYTPSTGFLSIIGKLSPASYIFGGFVKLTGGFALCAWFKDTTDGGSAGDFVVTVGGYHPAFDKPKSYPVVPRLGIAFSLGPIKVTGQAYVALTPGAFMAGIALVATFEAGPVSAWFTAGLDFLIAWAPFSYLAHAWVAIGCKVDLGLFSIRLQIGADLQIWGPPFGGRAIVDLDVVSFTIAFGAPATAPAPVGWESLAAGFLPPPVPAPPRVVARLAAERALRPAQSAEAQGADGQAQGMLADEPTVSGVVSASVTQGLISTTTPGLDWIVDGNHFRIAVRTTVPANHPRLGTGETGAGATSTAELPNIVADYTREVVAALRAAPADDPARDTGTHLPLTDLLPSDVRLALDPTTETFSPDEVWQPKLSVAPMAQHGVLSYLTITLCRRDVDGDGWSTYVTDLTVLPQLSGANAALWGDGTASTTVNGERLVPYALVGLDLTPVPDNPSSINAVALLELIFAEGISTGFVFQPAALPSTYTVHGTVSDDATSLDITVGGAHVADLRNTGHVLSALTDSWVDQQRVAVLDELQALGFATPPSSAVHLSELATTQLSAWPGVALIGQPA